MKTLAALVNQAYPSPEWAVFFEVSNSTGFGAKRRADAIALGVWPSRGHAVVGFEFKEDRRDWLREKKNPEKADVIAAHCDRFYLVTAHADIAKVDELPEPWGLLVATKTRDRLLTVKQPVLFPDRDLSVMRRSFVAAMLRKVTENTIPRSDLQRQIADAVKAVKETTEDAYELRILKEQNARYRDILDVFQKTTGINMQDYRGPERLSTAVDAVLNLSTQRTLLLAAKDRLEISARSIDKALQEWPEGK